MEQATAAPSTQGTTAHTAPAIAPSQKSTGNPAATTQAQPGQTTVNDFIEYKVNGQPRRLSREEAARKLSIEEGGYQRLEQAAALERQAKQVLNRMKSPEDALSFLINESGLPKEKIQAAFEKWYADDVIRPAEMTEEQRQLHQAQKRIAEFEKREQERQQQEQQRQMQEMDAQTVQQLQKEIIEIADTSGLPKSVFTVSRIAHWMRINELKGLNAPKELIIEQVRKETEDVIRSLANSADGDTLERLLGPETAAKYHKHLVAKIRAKKSLTQPQQPTTYSQESEEKAPEKLRWSEYVKRKNAAFRS